MRLLLEREGYSVVEAHDGHQAVDLAVQHRPSLIVMDLNMPTMDAYQAIAEIRRVQGLESTPIVVVTMEDSAKAAEQVLALGADDYIMTVRAISPHRARQCGVQAAASGCVIASATSTHRGSNA